MLIKQRSSREPEQQHRLPGKPRRCWYLLIAILLILGSMELSFAAPPLVVYTPNPIETTPYGPAKADVLLHPSNFVPCFGGPIALCYYSGPAPNDMGVDLSCKVTDDGEFSNCRCVEIPLGPYYVDINGILDKEVYRETVKKCGQTGADCQQSPNMAPVCEAIRTKKFLPDAVPSPDTISTFSLALVSDFGIGQSNCPPQGDPIVPYAGCMTAPCVRTDDTFLYCTNDAEGNEFCREVPIDICTCPNFTGPYQVGQQDLPPDECTLGDGTVGANIWSAAYNPTVAKRSEIDCAPDLLGSSGCPLLPPIPDSDPLAPVIPDKPKGISCGKVCAEYRNTQNGIEVGFTCDATLCTVSSITDEFQLVNEACSGLTDGKKGISEILKLELAVGCSCCASQICGCEPSPETNEKISELNQAQRDLHIIPQCDYNGSLCGRSDAPKQKKSP